MATRGNIIKTDTPERLTLLRPMVLRPVESPWTGKVLWLRDLQPGSPAGGDHPERRRAGGWACGDPALHRHR